MSLFNNFSEKLKALEGIETVALTTNGVTLSRHLPDLVAAGLDNVNISLDTLVPQKFQFVGRRPGRSANVFNSAPLSLDVEHLS